MRRGFLALAVCFGALQAHAEASLELKTDVFSVVFDGNNGSLVALRQNGNSILTSDEAGLWRVEFDDKTAIEAGAFNKARLDYAFEYHKTDNHSAVLTYSCPEIMVEVTASVSGHDLIMNGTLRNPAKAVLSFALPGRIRFEPDQVKQFIFPNDGNDGVGLALTGPFFARQPTDPPTAWDYHTPDFDGRSFLYGYGESWYDDGVKSHLRVTRQGERWLGLEVVPYINKLDFVVNRAPVRDAVDLILIDSDRGPYFSGNSLGGKGTLWRVGAGVDMEAAPLVLQVVGDVMMRLLQNANDKAPVALIMLRGGPETGQWTDISVERWRKRLKRVCAHRGTNLVALKSLQEVEHFLRSEPNGIILNPYGEVMPTFIKSNRQASFELLRDFVRDGGHWFETGGAAFQYDISPRAYFTLNEKYPSAFADFMQLDTRMGSAALYRVQPRDWAPWAGATNPEAIFVPGMLGCGGDADGGYADRWYVTYVPKGGVWRAPETRITVGHGAVSNLRRYDALNKLGRKLEDKIPCTLYDTMRTAPLVLIRADAEGTRATLDKLPVPSQVHTASYLRGGFDKEYPDHLPPNPDFGTPEAFRALIDDVKARGHLFMPYTNPTWWCDSPPGPTFLREGEAPLLKRLDGSLSRERYLGNVGYTVCHWHPTIRAGNEQLRQSFIEEYPVDILFQDQCGARGWRYDTNPASPVPYAYTEGLLSMIYEDATHVPLSTEAGWDRVLDAEVQDCGMTFDFVPVEGRPGYRSLFKYSVPPELWRIYPIAQTLAHDKTMLFYHDLAQFVTNQEVLSWTIGLGFNMTLVVDEHTLNENTEYEWLQWLARLQKSVCARYTGVALDTFEHIRAPGTDFDDMGALIASYASMQVWANLGPEPRDVNDVQLPGFGFKVEGPEVCAGSLDDAGTGYVIEWGRPTNVWLYARERSTVRLPWNAGQENNISISFDGQVPVTGVCEQSTLRIQVPAREPEIPISPRSPRYIGVLDIGGPAYRAWVSISPKQWLNALEESSLCTDFGLEARYITSLDALHRALTDKRGEYAALINPAGETFPIINGDDWQSTLELIRNYVRDGGHWWETGGYSFYKGLARDGYGWREIPVAEAGLAYMGIPMAFNNSLHENEPIHVTEMGKRWLGDAIVPDRSPVDRGLPPGASITLVSGVEHGYIGGYNLGGHGGLWRIGGFAPDADTVLPVVIKGTDYVLAHPDAMKRPSSTRYVWHATIGK